MSIISAPPHRSHSPEFNQDTADTLDGILSKVQATVAPVWPLRDYVAVNPYGGLADETFLDARRKLRATSDMEILMPLAYYRERFQAGKLGLAEIAQAVDEMVEDRIPGAETVNANAIYQTLDSNDSQDPLGIPNERRLYLQSQLYDQLANTNWTETIVEEIGKHCAAHYDEGQAAWSSPYRELPLYQAWHAAAQLDRTMEVLGVGGFRAFVSRLPNTPSAAIHTLLRHAGVPQQQWADYLFCVASATPGWSAWTKYKTVEAQKQGIDQPDFVALLAIRLAYDVAVAEYFEFSVDQWELATADDQAGAMNAALFGMALLRANEIGFRNRLLSEIRLEPASNEQTSRGKNKSSLRKIAQAVFCIDVRSEPIRRNLEQASSQIETYGFAGFFGLPFEFVQMGEQRGTRQLPVLLEPQFRVYEDTRSGSVESHSRATEVRRARTRSMRQLWKAFQTSPVTKFAFVETSGLFYLKRLTDRMLGRPPHTFRHDGVHPDARQTVGPSFHSLQQQGVDTPQLVAMAEAILRGVGITKEFARIILFCGHAASTENNPLQAGLDCGACAGHSGEANARFAAMLLNRPDIRDGLADCGIVIPNGTHFLAGLHNTTTDEITYFDLAHVPDSSMGFVAELRTATNAASRATRRERLPALPGRGEDSLLRRSVDWSELRPEWGLTGNAAMIIGPRDLTKSFSLRGASFLHSYDYRRDSDGRLLEQIMTAPLVVANWINMQYFASTVDPNNFGSGSKTIHNVVGKFGILAGNGGDLTTGLPWESVHDGKQYQHHPMRLLAVIEAPRDWVSRILTSHSNVRDLVLNGWVNLIVADEQRFYRMNLSSQWQSLQFSPRALQSA